MDIRIRPTLLLTIEAGGVAVPLARIVDAALLRAAVRKAVASKMEQANSAGPLLARRLTSEALELEELLDGRG